MKNRLCAAPDAVVPQPFAESISTTAHGVLFPYKGHECSVTLAEFFHIGMCEERKGSEAE